MHNTDKGLRNSTQNCYQLESPKMLFDERRKKIYIYILTSDMFKLAEC